MVRRTPTSKFVNLKGDEHVSNEDLAYATVGELRGLIEAGSVSSRELVSNWLERIERYDEKLHAFVSVYEEDARQAALSADEARKAGHQRGPFHGIPVAVKDLVEFQGRITTGGSQVNAQRVSPYTATLIQRMIAAGMIVIGKTHTVEFAAGGWGTNQHLGTPWNPWDQDTHRAPGGSSAGSGVAVAAGLAPWAIGTDTGGSVRLPSSWCGLTGLKTTIGRISVHGVLPLSPTLDTPGPMGHCVEDVAELYVVLSGPDGNDFRTLLAPPSDPRPEMRKGVQGLRIARLGDKDLEPVSSDVRAGYETAITVLEELGAQVTDVELNWDFAEMGAAVGRIFAAEGYSFYGHLLHDAELPVDEDVKKRLLPGRDLSAADYLKALRERDTIKQRANAQLETFDALLTPTTLTAAPVVEYIDQTQSPAWFTRATNLLDRCAVCLPNGFSPAGLPLSLQIMCQGHHESMALRIAWAYQNVTQWHRRRPTLS